jgi:serine/threonine protein kinase
LLKDLLPVMEFIHSHRVIHRDIKPANIIRDRSTQKLFLVDLGAAKHATGSALAFTGTIIGSAEYTAPEQTRGKAVFASDLYSLGATCIHLLTQLSPFDLYDVSDGQWVWQDYLQSSVSPSLTQILNKLLENTTNRRYPSAIAVLSDLSKEDLSKFTPSVSYAHPLIEDWDVIAEKTAYQLGIHLSFKEAEALVKSTRSEIASQYRSSSFLKTSHRSKDLAFPAMLLLLTLPVFCWCVARSSSPPPQILRERIAPEYSDSIEPPLHF